MGGKKKPVIHTGLGPLKPPVPIEGSRLYRVYCVRCEAPMRQSFLDLYQVIPLKEENNYLVFNRGFWCERCWPGRPPWPLADSGYRHNTSPWQENAIRALEGDL